MRYTKEQVDDMIKIACDTQREIDYTTFKKIIENVTIEKLINYDYCYTKKNLDTNLDENDLTEIRDSWLDMDDLLDIIKKYVKNLLEG